MTTRKPIQIPSDLALCEDGTMWRIVPSSGGDVWSPFIPSHWEKVDDIPSNEEYEKQCETRSEMWENHFNEITKKGGIR